MSKRSYAVLYIRVDVLEKFTLHGADCVCVGFLDEHRILVDQPRCTHNVCRRILHLQRVISVTYVTLVRSVAEQAAVIQEDKQIYCSDSRLSL